MMAWVNQNLQLLSNLLNCRHDSFTSQGIRVSARKCDERPAVIDVVHDAFGFTHIKYHSWIRSGGAASWDWHNCLRIDRVAKRLKVRGYICYSRAISTWRVKEKIFSCLILLQQIDSRWDKAFRLRCTFFLGIVVLRILLKRIKEILLVGICSKDKLQWKNQI